MNKEVSESVLEETPQRVLPFLRAIATRVEIRSAMAACGYTQAEHERGWKLLLDVSGYTTPSFPVTADQKARAAIAELDGWDEPGFRRIRAALGRLHPEQEAFVFEGMAPGSGAASVVSVAMMLDRLDALESGADRAATRDADHAALATLSQRGIDGSERARLRELVNIAKTANLPVVTVSTAMPSDRLEKLKELHAWFADWSETARAVIRRRDYLIFMGLAKRKRVKANGTSDVVAPVPPAPELPVQ